MRQMTTFKVCLLGISGQLGSCITRNGTLEHRAAGVAHSPQFLVLLLSSNRLCQGLCFHTGAILFLSKSTIGRCFIGIARLADVTDNQRVKICKRIHTLSCKCLLSFTLFYCKLNAYCCIGGEQQPMFRRMGIREERKPLPLAFQCLIFMI